MNQEITVTIKFTIREATGVNPNGKALEVLDNGKDRVAYVDSVSEAETVVEDLCEQSFGYSEPVKAIAV